MKQFNAYQDLLVHYKNMQSFNLKQAFNEDKNRFSNFTLNAANLTVDFSKNFINKETLGLLIKLANESNMSEAIKDMFSGKKINRSENRSVLHTALRNRQQNLIIGNENVGEEIKKVQLQMQNISNKIRAKQWFGNSGKVITDVVNIGIGGSFLGPKMAINALAPFNDAPVNSHFLANIDGSEFYQLVKNLNPETTLFIVASKSFTTLETLKNTEAAAAWIKSAGLQTGEHFIAVSTNIKAAKELGIADEHILPMWDFVGGRFSMWSAVGLIIAIAIGFDRFTELLDGAFEMDEHFKNAPFNENLPVISGLLAVWYQNFYNTKTHAILPYDHYLRFLPSYLQQLDMESTGKSCKQNGDSIDYQTGAIIWGDEGCNGQHSYHQLLHQGTVLVPSDFIAVIREHNKVAQSREWLLANCFAQSLALAFGEVKEPDNIQNGVNVSLNKYMPGNRPSTTIVLDKLTPKTLGSLIALYEHKVFVQAHIWGINAFDQWGVQLGKIISDKIYATMTTDEQLNYDSSTNGLINIAKKLRAE